MLVLLIVAAWTERANIGAFLLWVTVLAVALLRAEWSTATRLAGTAGRLPSTPARSARA